MATKKFIIEVEEGRTKCENCPLGEYGYCMVIHIDRYDCYKYNLATMKIKELEEEK